MDLPSRLWRYCMSATFGLPFVSFNNRTGVTQLPSQAGSLGTGVGGAYGFPVQMEIATQVGACTCTEGDGTWGGELRARGRPMNRGTVVRGVPTSTACTGMQATHHDYWRQRSPSTVSWALNPGCMTDATLAIDRLRYFA